MIQTVPSSKPIRLTLNCPWKKPIIVSVESETTIGEISNQLYDVLKCRDDEKCLLLFEDRILDNDQTIQSYNLTEQAHILVKVERIQTQNKNQSQTPKNESDTINLQIEHKSQSYIIKAKRSQTIKQVFGIILTLISDLLPHEYNGIGATLNFAGRTLLETDTIESLHLIDGSILQTFIRSIGAF